MTLDSSRQQQVSTRTAGPRSMTRGTTLVRAGTVHRFEVLSREVTVVEDYAICHMRAIVHGRWADADEDITISLRSTEVLRRGDDGQWRYFIDHGA